MRWGARKSRPKAINIDTIKDKTISICTSHTVRYSSARTDKGVLEHLCELGASEWCVAVLLL
jgi:hypothetical protein